MPVIYTDGGKYVTVTEPEHLRIRASRDVYWLSKLVGWRHGYQEDISHYYHTEVIEALRDRIIDQLGSSNIFNVDMVVDSLYEQWMWDMASGVAWQHLARLERRYPQVAAVADDDMVLEIAWQNLFLLGAILTDWIKHCTRPDARHQQLMTYFMMKLESVCLDLCRRFDHSGELREEFTENGFFKPLPDYSLN